MIRTPPPPVPPSPRLHAVLATQRAAAPGLWWREAAFLIGSFLVGGVLRLILS